MSEPEILVIQRQANQPFVPIVCMHGTGGNGANLRALVAPAAEATLASNSLLIFPCYETPYQYLLPDRAAELFASVTRLGVDYAFLSAAPKLLLYGFSGGAQFCHRLALQYPQRVHGCVALAAGSWTAPDGEPFGMQVEEGWFDNTPPWNTPEIAEALRRPAQPGFERIKWVIGCGSQDLDSRIRSAARFGEIMRAHGAQVSRLDSDLGHEHPTPDMWRIICQHFNRWIGECRQDAGRQDVRLSGSA